MYRVVRAIHALSSLVFIFSAAICLVVFYGLLKEQQVVITEPSIIMNHAEFIMAIVIVVIAVINLLVAFISLLFPEE